MDANKIAAQITGLVTRAFTGSFGLLLWVIGSIAILAVASTVLAPVVTFVRLPSSDVQKWTWIAGFLYLMRGAGR